MQLVETRKTARGNVLRYNLHPGQQAAWECGARFVVVLAGTQGGKTEFGPLWLHREMQRRGPGDYLVVSPSYPLMQKKTLPAFEAQFVHRLRLGRFAGGAARFFALSEAGARSLWGAAQSTPTSVFFGHAQDPDSLESATAKAAWLDEAGQSRFKLGSWEAIQRRLAIHEGRALVTTTPYNLGWLKTNLCDLEDGKGIAVIRFKSTMNPAFPAEEWERARRVLPAWRFALFYEAQFARPAGMIYDVFSDSENIVPAFDIPPQWPRFVGFDFGAVHTAAVFFALDPQTTTLYGYAEYLAGGRTAAAHAQEVARLAPRITRAAGGAGSEQNWRDEFTAAGVPIARPSCGDVELGITRVHGMVAARRVRFLAGRCPHTVDQFHTYARKLDAADRPTEEIEDKADYHFLDACRYILSDLAAPDSGRVFMGRPKL